MMTQITLSYAYVCHRNKRKKKDNMKVHRQTKRKKILFGRYSLPVAG